MSTQVQLRRGTTAENDAFTGAQGELTMDTDTNGLRIHDGSTVGGFDVMVVKWIQKPNADNNYTWAFMRSDGWCEQGGIMPRISPASNPRTLTLPIEMADENYTVLTSIRTENTSPSGIAACIGVQTTTTVQFNAGYGTGGQAGEGFNWLIKGFAKE